MTVLNDKKIIQYLDEGKLIIEPKVDDIQIQPASIDLKLDNSYLTFKTTSTQVIDTKEEQYYTEYHTFSDNNPLILHPHQLVLAQTYEKVKIPDNLLARVEGRSSFGRLGVVIHVTAGFIDPGFEGNITLEMVNLGNIPVKLYPYQRICQIVFEELNESCMTPYGVGGRNKYQGQNSPTPSRTFNDK